MTTTDFPDLHVLEPQPGHAHTHTAIMLHGRGSGGEEFEEALGMTDISTRPWETLFSHFPSWRWVFPSAPMLWSSTYHEAFPQWFDIASLTDVDDAQMLQTDGIKRSTAYLLRLIDQEVDRLQGRRDGVFVCGISQGGAIGLWAMLCQNTSLGGLGGFVGWSTWLPFSDAITNYLSGVKTEQEVSAEETEAAGFVAEMMYEYSASGRGLLDTPVFLGHGSDDCTIDIENGEKIKEMLESVGVTPEWKVYEGAELSGHWIKDPEGVVDVANFFKAQIEKNGAPMKEEPA